jgi:hypothetical protein
MKALRTSGMKEVHDHELRLCEDVLFFKWQQETGAAGESRNIRIEPGQDMADGSFL